MGVTGASQHCETKNSINIHLFIVGLFYDITWLLATYSYIKRTFIFRMVSPSVARSESPDDEKHGTATSVVR